jgi:hypothetical protein
MSATNRSVHAPHHATATVFCVMGVLANMAASAKRRPLVGGRERGVAGSNDRNEYRGETGTVPASLCVNMTVAPCHRHVSQTNARNHVGLETQNGRSHDMMRRMTRNSQPAQRAPQASPAISTGLSLITAPLCRRYSPALATQSSYTLNPELLRRTTNPTGKLSALAGSAVC